MRRADEQLVRSARGAIVRQRGARSISSSGCPAASRAAQLNRRQRGTAEEPLRGSIAHRAARRSTGMNSIKQLGPHSPDPGVPATNITRGIPGGDSACDTSAGSRDRPTGCRRG
jgi:hypothetical protein